MKLHRIMVLLVLSGAVAGQTLAGQRAFASPSTERAARGELRDEDHILAQALAAPLTSSQTFRNVLVAFDSLTAKTLRHWWYLRVRCAINSDDQAACEETDQVVSSLNDETTRLSHVVSGPQGDTILGWLSADPSLQRYGFLVHDLARSAGRTLAPTVVALLDTLQGPAINWEFREYLALRTHFAQPRRLADDAPRADRAAAYRARFTGPATYGDLYAIALVQTVLGRNALSRAAGYPDAPTQVLEARYLTPDSVLSLLAAIRAHADLTKRYERAQLALASLSATDTSIGPWDLAAARTASPVIPVDSATTLIKRALSPLGREYSLALDSMLAPSAGRLDLGPGAHRTPGGFSFGTLGVPAGVYLAAYDSTPTGARRLAHELGHAMHRELMADAGTAPVYFNGAQYLSEAVALFNELVVMDTAVATAGSTSDRLRLEEAFLDKALDVFYSAQDAELELAIYQGVDAGHLRTAADFDSLTRSIDEAYSIWGARVPERAHRWIGVRLMWEDPLYLSNYVLADLIGLKLFALYERDHRAFAPEYLGFLRAGYSDAPATLINRFFRFDLDSRSLLDDATQLLDTRLRRYETH